MNRINRLIFAVLIMLMLIFGAAACGTAGDIADDPQKPGQNQKDGPDPKEQEQDEEDNQNKDSGVLGNGQSKYSKEELLKEMNDVPIRDFELEALDGSTIKLSDQKGKIVLLNLWATWCPPCRAEMPYLQEVYDEYKDGDVIILAVNSTDTELRGGSDSQKAEKQVREFMEDNGYTFPVLLDRDNEVWNTYQYRGAVPVTYIIDKEGIIRYLIPGAFMDKAQILDFIERVRIVSD
jgi:cytochrome c-type biogenesis protein